MPIELIPFRFASRPYLLCFPSLRNPPFRPQIADFCPLPSALNSPHSRHCERDRFEFCGKRLRLFGCELDQRRPHRPPCRIVRVDRNGLFQRSDHRLSAVEHLTHDI
jgi:hypothetical protein